MNLPETGIAQLQQLAFDLQRHIPNYDNSFMLGVGRTVEIDGANVGIYSKAKLDSSPPSTGKITVSLVQESGRQRKEAMRIHMRMGGYLGAFVDHAIVDEKTHVPEIASLTPYLGAWATQYILDDRANPAAEVRTQPPALEDVQPYLDFVRSPANQVAYLVHQRIFRPPNPLPS